MIKKIISTFLVIVIAISLCGSAFASQSNELTPYASYYLNDYTVILSARGNGVMEVTVDVNGVGVQDVIGVSYIDIEQKVNGTWQYCGTLDASEHPDFYEYNSQDYLGSVTFTGTPGVTYRVTVQVYAEKDGGWDTGYITSYTVTCK